MGNDEVGIWVRVGAEPIVLSWTTLARALVAALGQLDPARAPASLRMKCEGAVWVVEGLGESCRVATGRGVELLAKLVDEPGRDWHVLELCGASAGDAGELLDAASRAAYRTRVLELRETLAEAEHWHDLVRRERAQAELEALEDELARGVGLRGRSRRACSATERARSNIQRRLACAIRKVRDAAPRLGEHLAATVKTGTRCVYRPELARAGSYEQ